MQFQIVLFVIDFNVHAQQRRFHAFAQRVEAQGARRAAVQGMMHDEVEAVQLGQVVAYDVAENESFKGRYWTYRSYRRSGRELYLSTELS